MSVLVDRLLVGKISPGTRVTVVGIYSVCGSKDSGGPKRKDTNGAVAIRQPYLRVVGIEGDLDEDARQTRAFTCVFRTSCLRSMRPTAADGAVF